MLALVLSLARLITRPCVYAVVLGDSVLYSGSCRRSALRAWRSALRGSPGLAVFVSGASVARVRL